MRNSRPCYTLPFSAPHSNICNTYVLSIFYVPQTSLGARDTLVHKIDKDSRLHGISIRVGRHRQKIIDIINK